MNMFIFYFPYLKDKVLCNKTVRVLELLEWKKRLCLGNTK